MNEVLTPDGWGRVLRTQSAHGRTSYLVEGAGFQGWYDGLQVTADFADHPDDVIPNEENSTDLPYPSRPQGPGWDGSTSTIPPDIDPHLEMDGNSDSLTGQPTSEDSIGADLDGDFEPNPHLGSHRARRVHFASLDDPILDVSALPEESPTGLENSPLNPDGVSTDDLFEHGAATTYDRLVIEDDLSFMRFAADEDDDKRERNAGQPGFLDDDSDDDGSDDSGSSDGDSDGGDGGDGGGDGGSGGHTAAVAFALTTTADLHFLANLCVCSEALPLHSKSEHRELAVEAASDVEGVNPQPRDLDKLYERYEQGNFNYQESNLRNLVDNSEDSGDSADLYNHLAATKTAAPAEPAQPTQIESQIEQLMQFWAVDNNGWWHWTGSQSDLALLNQMQQQMMAVGMQSGPPGQMQAQGSVHTANPALLAALPEMAAAGEAAGAAEGGTAASQGGKGMLGNLIGGGGGSSPAGLMSGMAGALNGLVGSDGDARVTSPVRSYGFAIETNTPAPWRDYLQTVASDKLVALAAWRDVVEKSKRLRSEGAIDLETFKPEVITAYIQGDHGRYYTTVQRLGSVPGKGRQLTSTQVSGWSCECEWGHWAWIRKRSFVGRMCSHAYALFSEMRSLDAKARKGKGKPLSAGKFASTTKVAWFHSGEAFVWVTEDPTYPTAAISRTASGWNAQIWSDGTADDSLDLGTFRHSKYALHAVSGVIKGHMKLAEQGDVDMVGGGTFNPGEETSDDPYTADGEPTPEPLLSPYDEGPGPGIQESQTRVGFSAFAEAKDGDDDEGPETQDDGIQEDEPDDDESLDEEIAEDEDGSNDGQDDEGSEPVPDDDGAGDGGHYEPHKRDDDDGDDEGTDNPGDESDDDHVEKQSSVAELQQQYGLTHLAGANYSPAQQARLVGEGEGKTARNRGDLNLTGTHYEASSAEPEDTLAFLF